MNAAPTARLLDGHRILITGGARGLGLEFARATSCHGARVVIADVLADLATQAAEQLRAQGLDVHALPLDLADAGSIAACAVQATRALGGLDGLVNNGAITNSGGRSALELEPDIWDRVMNVNVRGTWLMTRECVKALAASGRGAIVNLASDTPLWGARRTAITVNAVAPGLTLVEATQYVLEHRHRLYKEQRALARDQMPEDVCGAVVFALSSLSRFVTGQLLAVNGGFVMH
jgi:NAD(P)-dependent dehydrogenase (short-subunit alcohol dehydrogenase family)